MPPDYTEIKFDELQKFCEKHGYGYYRLKSGEDVFMKFFNAQGLCIVIETGFFNKLLKRVTVRISVMRINDEEQKQIFILKDTRCRKNWRKTLNWKRFLLEKLLEGGSFCPQCGSQMILQKQNGGICWKCVPSVRFFGCEGSKEINPRIKNKLKLLLPF